MKFISSAVISFAIYVNASWKGDYKTRRANKDASISNQVIDMISFNSKSTLNAKADVNMNKSESTGGPSRDNVDTGISNLDGSGEEASETFKAEFTPMHPIINQV